MNFLLGALLMVGCLKDVPPVPRTDGGESDAPSDAGRTRVAGVRVLDVAGGEHPELEAPRRPTIVIDVAGTVNGVPEPALLLRGAPDDALRTDLDLLPMRADTSARLMAVEVSREARWIEMVPREVLGPGLDYTVALA